MPVGVEGRLVFGRDVIGIVSVVGLNSTVFFNGVFRFVMSGIWAESVVFNAGIVGPMDNDAFGSIIGTL